MKLLKSELKEIIQEASDVPIKQKIKRASGGVAYMLGE